MFVMGVGYASSTVAAVQPAVADNVPVKIAIHKALYSFKLVSVEAGVGLNGVEGKMYFEQDDVCDAWTTDRRFTTEYMYTDRSSDTSRSHYTAFESKDRQQFSFSSERQEDDETVELLRGAVHVGAEESAQAVYSRPDDVSYDLPKGYFLPTQHSIEVIRRARAGDKLFSGTMFDGTDVDGPVDVNVFIGKKLTSAEIKKIAAGNKKIDPHLLAPDAWHIRMAVFPIKNREDMMPAYEIEMIMHDNGVVSDALVDYKMFKVAQSLAALEKLSAKKCP